MFHIPSITAFAFLLVAQNARPQSIRLNGIVVDKSAAITDGSDGTFKFMKE